MSGTAQSILRLAGFAQKGDTHTLLAPLLIQYMLMRLLGLKAAGMCVCVLQKHVADSGL